MCRWTRTRRGAQASSLRRGATQLTLSIAAANVTTIQPGARHRARGLKETDHGRHDSTRRVLLRAGAQQGGEGARFLTALQGGRHQSPRVLRLPRRRGSQLDFVPADPAAFKQFARTAKWKLTAPRAPS